MSFFKRRSNQTSPVATSAATAAPALTSKVLAGIMRYLERAVEEGAQPRVLLVGPPSGPTIQSFHSLGCKVTVDGEGSSGLPLGHEDKTFDVVLAGDTIDFVSDEVAEQLCQEWVRVLKPQGRIYLLARGMDVQAAPLYRVDVTPEGALTLKCHAKQPARKRIRSNRAIEQMFAPLKLDEIFLRRDGLREMAGRR